MPFTLLLNIMYNALYSVVYNPILLLSKIQYITKRFGHPYLLVENPNLDLVPPLLL